MILSSHYVIKDILHTVERQDVEEIKKICQKYTNRYRNDRELTLVCDIVMRNYDKMREKELSEMKSKLEELLSIRKLDVAGGTGLWFADRRKINR